MGELQDYLTGIADAIRSKKGTTAPINAKDFASEIESIAGSGGGGSVEIPPVTNLAVENGVLTFTKPNVVNLIEGGAVIKYGITINNTNIEVDDSGVDITNYLTSSINIIKVKTIAYYLSDKVSVSVAKTVIYELCEIISEKMPVSMTYVKVATIGNNIYIFGGRAADGSVDTIYKFNSENETITTLSTTLPKPSYSFFIGTYENICILIMGDKVYEFNSISETITTIDITLPYTITQAKVWVVNDLMYIFGGVVSGSWTNYVHVYNITNKTFSKLSITCPNGYYGFSINREQNYIYLFGGSSSIELNVISKFDTTSQTFTTLVTTLPQKLRKNESFKFGDDIYIFGGNNTTTNYNQIYKFNIISETITTLSTTLPTTLAEYGLCELGSTAYLFGGAIDNSTITDNIIKFY